ncbi:MAG: EAL domain-containing protein [Myxococcales bacterium]|nr:EAL domain-containing protein [Myxococcales bacterium]
MSSLLERFGLEEPPTNEIPLTQVSGVHEAPTQPAPYVEDVEGGEGAVGSIPTADLTVLYEPVIELSTGNMVGFEAHARSRTPGLEDPAELFARAVLEHRVGELGRIIREQALSACAGTSVFLKVHGQELKEGWLIRPDDAICSHDAEIVLEVAQSTYSSVCRQVLAEVRSRGGISLCVDDFGAGTSNTLQVVQLAPNHVRLDGQLVAGIDSDPRRIRALQRVVDLMSDLGATVIAKGLSTRAEVSVVHQCGVHYGQGPVLGSLGPLPRLSHPAR